jgi:hypothetical protein
LETAAALSLEEENNKRIIKAATLDIPDRFYQTLLLSKKPINGLVIAQFITSLNTEVNPSRPYRIIIIEVLTMLSKFLSYNKEFKDMTREDIISFLNSRRKTEEADPLHKWIGTYNNYRTILVRFFRWLYFSDIQPGDKRPKPAVIENIPELTRKEESIYKASDLWTPYEDMLFLKYCPSKRMKCYHMMSRDLSACPHEIPKLKVKDIVFKSERGHNYAQVTVNGKTGEIFLYLIHCLILKIIFHQITHFQTTQIPQLYVVKAKVLDAQYLQKVYFLANYRMGN